MAAALALAERTRGATAPNPNVGCVIVRDDRVVGRGWTRAGGRPHAEAVALAQAGALAKGATAYVTLEPCAHVSHRGPACSELLAEAGVARVVAGIQDPDPRTAGAGFARLHAGGIAVEVGVEAAAARASMAGFLSRAARGRPFVTLKLATSLDGCIARGDGESRWITGPEARAHAHLERSRHEAILVGRGTWDADAPALDVRLPGLEARSPVRVVLSGRPIARFRHSREGGDDETRGERDEGHPVGGGAKDVIVLSSPDAIASLPGDPLLLYRAPILIGGGLAALGDIGLGSLAEAHGRWRLADARRLGSDRMEVYERGPCSPGSSPT